MTTREAGLPRPPFHSGGRRSQAGSVADARMVVSGAASITLRTTESIWAGVSGSARADKASPAGLPFPLPRCARRPIVEESNTQSVLFVRGRGITPTP